MESQRIGDRLDNHRGHELIMKISRRKLLTLSAAAGVTLATPRLARAGVTLHPDPSGDDWAQFDAAMSGLRSNRLGWVEFEQF